MLRLTLQEGEYVLLGEDIKVSFDHIDGRDRIFIGIDAPRDLQILRSKLYERYVADRAESGDPEFVELHRQMLRERDQRNRRRGARMESRRQYDAAVETGEVTPRNPRYEERLAQDREFAQEREARRAESM